MTLFPGDALPPIRAVGNTNPDYVLDTAAGRYLVLVDLTAATEVQFDSVAALVARHRVLFDDTRFCFFGFLAANCAWRDRAKDMPPGVRWLFDGGDIAPAIRTLAGPGWILVDPMLRVISTGSIDEGEVLLGRLHALPPPALHSGGRLVAPVLILPRVFEPDFCKALIEHYDSGGGTPSGFMREIDGVTRLHHDLAHKRRSDVLLQDGPLQEGARTRIARRLAPQLAKAFQFHATRVERYLVAAYDSASGGWFRPHRDNTTKGTAHRRFAASINLNADYDGGDLRFPEWGDQTYRPPAGGACLFSCSILHEAMPVTRGRRYAFLPFLYDEAAARIRSENLKFLDLESPPEPAIQYEQYSAPPAG